MCVSYVLFMIFQNEIIFEVSMNLVNVTINAIFWGLNGLSVDVLLDEWIYTTFSHETFTNHPNDIDLKIEFVCLLVSHYID